MESREVQTAREYKGILRGNENILYLNYCGGYTHTYLSNGYKFIELITLNKVNPKAIRTTRYDFWLNKINILPVLFPYLILSTIWRRGRGHRCD